MKKVLATDLDGTLFFPKKRIKMIAEKSLIFLRNFIDEGGKLIIVSGRNKKYVNKVIKRINRPVDVIGCNSSYILSNNEQIKETYFDNKRIKTIYDEINAKYKIRADMIMTSDDNYVSKHSFRSLVYRIGYVIYSWYQGVYKEKFIKDDKKYYDEWNNGKIYKIMIMFGVGKKARERARIANKEIREKYGNELEASWSKEMIELSPCNCSKAEGLKYYLNYHKISRDDIMVVGDSGNDISMFNEFYENSYCMKNASLSVSKYAKYTIKNFWDLEKYIERK